MSWNERQIMNRRFQSSMNQEDAFITGYFFVWFEVPEKIVDVYNTLFGQQSMQFSPPNVDPSAEDMGKMLSALTSGVPSIPDTTLAKASNVGMGGPKWGTATNLDHPTNVSFKFIELAGIPVCKTIMSWFTLIRDPNSGVCLLLDKDCTKRNWIGRSILAYVKPDGVTVEMATRFEGIHPLKYPSDLFTSDVATVEPLQPEIDFHVDSIWSDTKAFEEAREIVKKFNQNKPFAESGKATVIKDEENYKGK